MAQPQAVPNRRGWQRILDPWTWFSFKGPWQSPSTAKPVLVPSWIGHEHLRRLWAYSTLEAYFRNAARLWLNDEASEEDRKARREYGDPMLLVEQTRASLYGDKISLIVKGAVEGDSTTDSASVIQEFLETWWEKEVMDQKLIETDKNAIKLGDGVMSLEWNEKKQRPCVYSYNPGFYFPVLDETGEDRDYPRRVHIAWEYEKTLPDGNREVWVRRKTWWLAEYDTTSGVRVPYSDEPVFDTCMFQDGSWSLEDMGKDVDNFDDAKAVWHTEPTDLEIDFIPVLHIPNTVSLEDHYGTSILANVLQLLDDIVAVDTDLQAASATTGSPPIAVSGASVDNDHKVYGPGTVLSVGDGSATVIDTSGGLGALLTLQDAQLKRLSVNVRIPEALLGRVKPNEVPSGIALALGFTPHISLIQEMRLVRRQKHGLLLKWVQRMMLIHGQIPEVLEANIVFGSYLPADKQETMTLIVGLYTIKAISLETCIQMMVQAGFPIEDVQLEIQRIQQEDISSASALVSLTGDVNAGRERLGLPPDPTMANQNLNDPANPSGQ